MRFKAAAFDLDGTLYPASALGLRALPLVARHPLAFAAYAAVRRGVRKPPREGGAPQPQDRASFRARQAALTAEALGPLLGGGGPEARAARARELLDEVFYRELPELFAGLPTFRGAAEALDALAAGGLRLALLSDLPPGRKLELLGLGGRFEIALCSEDSGRLKPAPEPLLMLAADLGLDPGQMLYVGNSRAYDLAGARAAGMASAIVSRGRAGGADLAFWDWRELVDFALS